MRLVALQTENNPVAMLSNGVSSGDSDRYQPLDRFHAFAFAANAKQFIAPYILLPDAAIVEPIVFEMLRFASDIEATQLKAQFATLPLLSTPTQLWTDAAELGRSCRKQGIQATSLDLLISTTAIHRAAQLITFDDDFQRIASVSALQVQVLQRPTP